MFDQLDDPAGFTPTDAFRGGVRRRTRQLHRRRRARRLAAVAVVPTVAVVGVAVGLERRLDSVQRVDIGDRGADPLDTGAPVTILVLGTDAAPHDPARAQVHGVRNDTIVVARIDPKSRVATLSIPRDLWTGAQKLGELSSQELVTWLAEHLGLHIDHLISMDMEGFAHLADRVEPRVDVGRPIRDRNSGLDLDAGCQELDGHQVLAYVRARHLQELQPDRTWRLDPTSDLGRMARTTSLETALWPQLRRLGVSDLPALVDLLARSATIDSGLSVPELVDLARSIRAGGAPTAGALPVRMSEVPVGESGSTATMSVTLPVRGEATDAALSRLGGRLGPETPVATALPSYARPPPLPELEPALGIVSPC